MPFRLLIAEEHDECRQLFRRFLLRCGYEVVTAADGLGCIETLRTGPKPDVLILSWELPWCCTARIHGHELAAVGGGRDGGRDGDGSVWRRADGSQSGHPGADGVCEWLETACVDDIAVVVLTARMDADSAVQEQSLPRVTWVQRPFRLTDLLHAIQSADSISRHSWRCLETLWRKTTSPFNGILFDSAASTRDLSAATFHAVPAPAQPRERV
ncbi:MAG: response regulator [Planctomycetota bacterium]